MSRLIIKLRENKKNEEEYLRHQVRCKRIDVRPLSELHYLALASELRDLNLTDAYVARKALKDKGVRK